jgi:hypothetical protein
LHPCHRSTKPSTVLIDNEPIAKSANRNRWTSDRNNPVGALSWRRPRRALALGQSLTDVLLELVIVGYWPLAAGALDHVITAAVEGTSTDEM